MHADKRLKERSQQTQEDLDRLRKALKKAKLSPKAHHYRFRDGSMAVLKPVKNRHVVATVLSRNMRPPGQDVRHLLDKAASGWVWLVRRALQG